MRYTIPGEYAAHARKIARLNDTTRADWWRTNLRGDRLRGIGNGADRPVSVHRERVRFGAWEARPQDATTGRLTLGTGGSEGPPVSGPENAYKRGAA